MLKILECKKCKTKAMEVIVQDSCSQCSFNGIWSEDEDEYICVVRPNSSLCSSTKFPKVPLGVRVPVALGNMTQWYVLFDIDKDADTFVLAVQCKGKIKMPIKCVKERKHVEEKSLRYKFKITRGDSGNLADFVNSQLGHEGPLQGFYDYPNLLQ